MSQPAEPEKYTLDEMLERLQGKSSSEEDDSGELVTRADGTQAIKIRKRKRRSKQPQKEAAKKASRMRVVQVSATVILLALLGTGAAGTLLYANSKPYRDKLIDKFSQTTGAETKFQVVQVSPTAINFNLIDFQWPSGSPLKSLTLTAVRAQALLGGAFGSSWGVNELSADHGTLVIGAPENGEPTRKSPAPSGKLPASVNRLAVENLSAIFGNPAAPVISLQKTEASFYPSNSEGNPSVRLFRGQATVPGWPQFRLDRALVDFHKNEVDIVNLRLLHESDNIGSIELSGKFDPAKIDGEQSLGVKINSFNISGLAGTSLGNLVAGRIDSVDDSSGSNRLTFSSGKPDGQLRVAFASPPTTLPRLSNFPFLNRLSQITDNTWYIDPLFHDGCKGTLLRENGVVRISDLILESKSQLKVTGDLSLGENEILTGTLLVGLPEGVVAGGRNPVLPQLFKDKRDGFLWVSVKISGTSGRPVDDFAEQVTAAAGLPAAPSATGGDLFDRLTAPQ